MGNLKGGYPLVDMIWGDEIWILKRFVVKMEKGGLEHKVGERGKWIWIDFKLTNLEFIVINGSRENFTFSLASSNYNLIITT